MLVSCSSCALVSCIPRVETHKLKFPLLASCYLSTLNLMMSHSAVQGIISEFFVVAALFLAVSVASNAARTCPPPTRGLNDKDAWQSWIEQRAIGIS